MSLTEANPSTNSAGAAASAVRAASGRAALELALARGELREVEILWNDHQGHPRGKRITADGFLERAQGQGFAFCDAVLCWDVTGDVKDGLRWSSWDTGFPDLFAIPDLDTYRAVPWRTGVGQVICDLYGHDRQLVRAAPARWRSPAGSPRRQRFSSRAWSRVTTSSRPRRCTADP